MFANPALQWIAGILKSRGIRQLGAFEVVNHFEGEPALTVPDHSGSVLSERSLKWARGQSSRPTASDLSFFR